MVGGRQRRGRGEAEKRAGTESISTFHRFNVFISGRNGVLLIKKGNFPNHFSQLIIRLHLSCGGLVITSPTNLLRWNGK